MSPTHILRCCFFFSLIFSSLTAKDWKQNYLNDVDFIHHSYETTYAPAIWKQEHLNCDFANEVLLAKHQILDMNKDSQKEFHIILRNLMKSLKDYHVSILFCSTEQANLPFQIKEAQGKYYFVYIDNERVKNVHFPFEVGDELLIFDGNPVDEVVNALMKRTSVNTPSTDKAIATISLTNRFGMKGDRVPNGYVTLIGRKSGKNAMIYASLPWAYFPELVKMPNTLSIDLDQKKALSSPCIKFMQKNALFTQVPRVQAQFTTLESEMLRFDCEVDNKHSVGAPVSFVPHLGRVLWESDQEDPFYAYTFMLPSGNIGGFIRIPHYFPMDPEFCMERFARQMGKFQKQTDILVIDQNNNPGGFLFYVYAMVSALSDKPLIVPKHRITISQKDVLEAWSTIITLEFIQDDDMARFFLGDTIAGYPIDKRLVDQILCYSYDIIQEWASGRQLTAPLAVYGVEEVFPHRMHYKKPVLLLTNELDFSGGDFFPAILQDNGIVKILGTRTAGAGGFLTRVDFPNLSGIMAFTFTGSIAERHTNQAPIENLGVEPDVLYKLTANDLEFGYHEYRNAIVSTLEEMLQKK